jgi:hypothetical protein
MENGTDRTLPPDAENGSTGCISVAVSLGDVTENFSAIFKFFMTGSFNDTNFGFLCLPELINRCLKLQKLI